MAILNKLQTLNSLAQKLKLCAKHISEAIKLSRKDW